MEIKNVLKMADERIRELNTTIKKSEKIELKSGLLLCCITRLRAERKNLKQTRSFINRCIKEEQ